MADEKNEQDRPQDHQQGNHGDMAERGVTRPGAMKSVGGKMHEHHEQMRQQQHEGHEKKEGHEEHGDMMNDQQRLHMLATHHNKTLWIYWLLIILGIWVIAFALSFSYDTAWDPFFGDGSRLVLTSKVSEMMPISDGGLGIWMMFVPTALGNEGVVADIDHLAGALVVTVSVIAMGEVVRAFRYLNIVLGLLIAAISLPRGRKTETYGTWDRLIV